MISFLINDVAVVSNNKEIKAIEKDKVLGICVFELQEEKSSILLLELKMSTKNIPVEEGLIRTALNYAANRGIYMAYVNSNSYFNKDLLERMNFEFSGKLYSCDIPTALQGSCCK